MKTLDALGAADRPFAGGKAYNCARLKQAGFPVPDGIVVPASATDAQIRALPEHPWFAALADTARFAVRSSGIGEDSEGHSFAGIHETRLNVVRADVADAVVDCRRSAASDQARAYRRARQLGNEETIGVLVQVMVDAAVSGVAFTIHPVTGANEIVVNAAPGLGDALVSGRVDPDAFTLRKPDGAVLASRPAAGEGRAILLPAQLRELSDLVLRIERHDGAPQDIEWCHDGRQFWIVQARPVTAAISRRQSEPEWTRANLAEVLPDQASPQVIAAYEDMLNRGQEKFMGRLLDPALGPMVKAFHGRMYMNLSQMRRVTALMGAPAANLLRSLGHAEQIQPQDEVATRVPLREILRCLPDFARLARDDIRAKAVMRQHEARTRETLRRVQAVEPRTLSDREIWSALEGWMIESPDVIKPVFLMSAMLGRETILRAICDRVGFSYERLVYPQLAAGAPSVSTQQAIDLVGLADAARGDAAVMRYLAGSGDRFEGFRTALAETAFLEELDRFLDRYGHRGRYESDWSLPRLHEDPAPVLFAIREQLRGAPPDMKAVAARHAAEAAAAWAAFAAGLRWWQRLTVLPLVRALIRRLKNQYGWREQVRSDLTRIVRYLRGYHLALADRLVERGWIARREDYFLLRLEEIGAAIRGDRPGSGLREVAARRASDMAAEKPLQMPLLMRESELPSLIGRSQQAVGRSGDVLVGLCVSAGAVEADVVVMRDPAEFANMKRGAILVAPATDPSWTPLFTLASGVIVEVGGMLSHASTIAREYGLPAIANVRDATRVLKTGERVLLDASGGRVVRREAAATEVRTDSASRGTPVEVPNDNRRNR